jgi:hypothetical protein
MVDSRITTVSLLTKSGDYYQRKRVRRKSLRKLCKFK